MPGLEALESFSEEHRTISGLETLRTQGLTPGSCFVHAPPPWNVLFCGRLLIPFGTNRISYFLRRNTFHWNRQQKSLKRLRNYIPSDAFPLLASGGVLYSFGGLKTVPWGGWG